MSETRSVQFVSVDSGATNHMITDITLLEACGVEARESRGCRWQEEVGVLLEPGPCE